MENQTTLQLFAAPSCLGHPWVSLAELAGDLPSDSCVATLLDASGQPLGSGLFDPRDSSRACRG